MIQYLKRNYQDLNRKDLLSLRRLTVRGDYESGFKQLLNGNWGNLDTCKIIIAKDTETDRYVGWTAASVLQSTSRKEIGVFVSWKYRRRGIGTKLVKKVIEFCRADKFRCFMHDDASTAFYRKFGAKRLGGYSNGWGDRAGFTSE